MSMQTDSLFGTVIDEQDSPLPGVTLVLSGGSWNPEQVTDAQGNYRFVGLSAGTYRVKAELDGFIQTGNAQVEISDGRSSQLHITMTSTVTPL